MSEMKSPFKRFGFKRTNISDAPAPHTTTTELTDLNNAGEPSFSHLAAEYAGDVSHGQPEEIRNLSEVEANRKLSVFRQEHQFDPNMPEAAFNAINDATQAHDRQGEAKLVGALVDDSPYPEV